MEIQRRILLVCAVQALLNSIVFSKFANRVHTVESPPNPYLEYFHRREAQFGREELRAFSSVTAADVDLVFKHGFQELWQFDYGASFGALFAHPIKRAIISKLLMGNDPKLGNHKCRLDLGRFLFSICSKGSGTFLNHSSGLSDIAVFVLHNERFPP